MKTYKKGVYYAYPSSDVAESLNAPNGCFYLTLAPTFFDSEHIILAHSERMLDMDALAETLDPPWMKYRGLAVKGEYWFGNGAIGHCKARDTT